MSYQLIGDLQKQAITGSRHTMPMPVSVNLLARQFNTALPNLACVCNITGLRTQSNWLCGASGLHSQLGSLSPNTLEHESATQTTF